MEIKQNNCLFFYSILFYFSTCFVTTSAYGIYPILSSAFQLILMHVYYHPLGYRLRVDLYNNGPAVLDSNITFTAVLSNPSGVPPSGPFYCVFYDEFGGSFTVTITSKYLAS